LPNIGPERPQALILNGHDSHNFVDNKTPTAVNVIITQDAPGAENPSTTIDSVDVQLEVQMPVMKITSFVFFVWTFFAKTAISSSAPKQVT